jgi:hypothetical protein
MKTCGDGGREASGQHPPRIGKWTDAPRSARGRRASPPQARDSPSVHMQRLVLLATPPRRETQRMRTQQCQLAPSIHQHTHCAPSLAASDAQRHQAACVRDRERATLPSSRAEPTRWTDAPRSARGAAPRLRRHATSPSVHMRRLVLLATPPRRETQRMRTQRCQLAPSSISAHAARLASQLAMHNATRPLACATESELRCHHPAQSPR